VHSLKRLRSKRTKEKLRMKITAQSNSERRSLERQFVEPESRSVPLINHLLKQEVIEITENNKSVMNSRDMKDLHNAAKEGLFDEVVRLLDNGEDPSAPTSCNNTPLHYVAYEGHTEILTLLIERNCEPNLPNDNGDTPLHLAAVNGKIDVLQVLCECEGIDVNKPSATNETILVYARHGGQKPMLDILRNPETISTEGNTPLHFASLTGQEDVVKLLLMKNADATNETPTHQTPLHYAALRGYATLVKLLVFHGADPNVRDERNNTPLHYAALNGHTLVVELLVNERADLSIRTDLGLSVLHKASFYGRLSTVQKLVELQDTLVSIRDKENLRAEDTALIRGHVHTAWWLNKNASEDFLQDQIHLKNICMSKYSQCGEFYHTYCEDKNTKSTALATAIDFGVCDLHYQDERGRTLLHVAAEQNDRRKIRVLLERGALPTARTHDGETPADLARQKGHLKAAERIVHGSIDKDYEKNELYTRLLTLITETANANLQGDNEEQEARLAAVKEASSLLASGAPLEPPGCHSCYPLHLAIGTNCTPLLPLLLASGAPLTSSADGFGPVQVAWMTPDATPWVGVVVTRAAIHKIQSEMKLLGPELQISAEILVKSLEGYKPWDAKVITSKDSSNSLLFRACAAGATTFAWWIWHSGGNTLSQDKDGETPLHAALDAGHLDTATALVLHMGANLFLPDHKGRAPVDLIPDDATREQLLQATLARECRRLNDESEKARDPTQKQEARQFVFLLLSLYCAYSSQTDKGRDALCWKTAFSWLEKELSESDDWMEKLVQVTNNHDTKRLSDVTYDEVIELIAEESSKYPRSTVHQSKSELDDALVKILDKAMLLTCEKDFSLFLYLLVHVGKQKVDSVIEVCQASPLHYAALKNNESAARYLVSHGASINAKDRFGNTPAHYACMHGYKDLGDLLKTYQVNRNGLTTMNLIDGFRHYLKLYDLDLKSLANIDIQKNNTGSQKMNILLKELKKKWQVNGIGEAIAKVHVNYSRGESKDIQAAVFSWADSIKNAVAKKNPMFSGELLMLGSSADNVRLFCPDEYDCNIILSSFNGYPNGGLQVSLEEKEPDYSDCKSKINVSSKNINIKNLLKGNNFLYTFYSMVKECISILEPEDKRLTMIPPGVKRTKVGVGLTLVWTGKEFPLLLVDVDIVPTMEAPWPADLPRPPLTPPHIKSVYISSIGDGEWRFSFAQAENEIMKNLTPDQRRVFLACKMVLSSLKVEKWAPKDIQNRYKYFDKMLFKIPSPKGFILKNTFFSELEDFRDHRSYWTDRLENRIRSIFGRMCEEGKKDPVKIEAYFAGRTESPCFGYGVSEIVTFFTPKPGFHGIWEYLARESSLS
ncbi:serine/threonine-protein phosphatase 6 regulatory ankyrin repeat subunit A-like, partial [Penaeus japonicus]|uniref:serine/threonine-protein phosphatase 6 regulatory ankyrin repeat subunit A-like n=1 Tax=Penaeus japonicus TaxID=27405 RepID=UPI001C70EBED